MNSHRIAFALVVGLFFVASSCLAAVTQGYAITKGTQIVDSVSGQPLVLRGINLGNWMLEEGYMFDFDIALASWQIHQIVTELIGLENSNTFWARYWDNFVTTADLDYIVSTGMNTIRLPFDFRLVTPPEYPGVWVDTAFQLMDRVVDYACALPERNSSARLYVLIGMHAAPCGQTGENIDNSNSYASLFDGADGPDTACLQRTMDVWARVAQRYANRTCVLGYDLLNEPIPPYPEYAAFGARLQPVYAAITKAIRTVDSNHMMFLGGAAWDSNFDVFTARPAFDPQLVYTFHKYWTAPDYSVIADYVNFGVKNQVPVFCGESGENSDEWIANFTQTLNTASVGWTFWTYKKLNSTSCMRSYAPPLYWDEIVAYQKVFGGSFDDKRKARPPRAHIDAALEGLLQNVEFAYTEINPGYIRALGMTP